jgi:rfaE bifunctional protein kinase chain/domain
MTTQEILSAFPKLKALVIGDICLDRWCTYDPTTSEPSRETGIPRLGVVLSQVTPGGGGTVCNNLAAIGVGKVSALGVRGDDGFGFELDRALAERGISTDLMVKVPTPWQTFTYTKLLNSQDGEEDQPRVDFISTKPLPKEAEQQIIKNFNSAVAGFDAVLVADQAETNTGGVVTPAVRDAIIAAAAKYPDKVFLVDSRKRVHLYRNMMLKPNQDEAEAASRALLNGVDFAALRRAVDAPVLFVTQGAKGAVVIENSGERWAEAHPVDNPVDICGAGDSFAAGCAMTMAVTRDPIVAASFGNLVASVTVMKKGTGTASPRELLAAAH